MIKINFICRYGRWGPYQTIQIGFIYFHIWTTGFQLLIGVFIGKKDMQCITNITHEEGLWHKKELTKTILYQLIIALTKLIKDFFLAFQNHIYKPYLLRLCDILLSPCEVFVN